jgi:hypothetical protein
MKDRRIVQRNGYVVIFSEDSECIPLCCPVCQVVLRTRFDEEEYRKLQCCTECSKNWAYPNIQKWKNGWRPDQEMIKNQKRSTIDFMFKID